MKMIDLITGNTFLTKRDIYKAKKYLFIKKYPEFEDINLIFYPIWILLIEGWADRIPFKPKRMEFVGYIDPFIKKTGLVDSIPEIITLNIKEKFIIPPPDYEFSNSLATCEKKMLTVDIRKLFALKTPKLIVIARKLMFLPCWKCMVKGETNNEKQIFVINCLNGIREYSIEKALSKL